MTAFDMLKVKNQALEAVCAAYHAGIDDVTNGAYTNPFKTLEYIEMKRMLDELEGR